tara:strand:+ start:43 stop:603 length:561 start_codon:yes stop_codon:yes gene_type:complete
MSEVIAVSIATLIVGFIIGRFIPATTFDVPTMNRGIRLTTEDHLNIRHEDNSLKQKLEDDNRFEHYARKRREHDFMRILENEGRTQMFILEHDDAYGKISNEDREEYKDAYSNYLVKKSSLGIITEGFNFNEFIIMNKNPLHCLMINLYFDHPSIYNIHNEATARYKGDSSRELLKAEFEEKYYKL